MLTAITPTGDRPHQFAICHELMMRQTVKPERWIIVDDGVIKVGDIVNKKRLNLETIIINRDPKPGKITIKDNLLAALDIIKTDDKIIFFEDDDFYPVTYIEVMSKLLNNYTVIGGLLRKYYNLDFQGYREFINPRYGNLNSVAFNVNEKTLKSLGRVCSNGNGYKVDIEFWQKIQSEGILFFLHSDVKAQVIGVKGWKVGRDGAVVETHKKYRRKFIYDPDFNALNRYFGDFSEKYKSFIEHGCIVDRWRAFLGELFKIRRSIKSTFAMPISES